MIKIIVVFMREYQRHKVALCWPAHVKFERSRQCEDVISVAWFVHECMERIDNSHTG
jgi:hypothetical protein